MRESMQSGHIGHSSLYGNQLTKYYQGNSQNNDSPSNQGNLENQCIQAFQGHQGNQGN